MAKKLLVGLIILFWSSQGFAQGCSTCRAQIEGADGSDLSVGNGLNTGIYILMGMPYIILFLLFRKQIIGFIKQIRTTP